MRNDYKYLVCTRCFTFNHAEFITDAMNGFTMQKTTFPVVTTIVDDASTDGEPDVIIKYLREHFLQPYRDELTEDAHIICAKHKTNPNCEFIVFLLKYNHYKKKPKMPYLSEWLDNAKYHALCEGDDYWVDPLKLQKQVDIIENDDDVSIVSGGFYSVKNGVRVSETVYKSNNNSNSFVFDCEQWKDKWFTKTLTVLYRRESLVEYTEKIKYYKYTRDIHRFYHLLKVGKGVYISEILGVYNIHEGSTCSTVPKELNALYNYQCSKELYNYNKDNVTRVMYYNSINSRLLNRLPKQHSFSLLKEGLRISISFNEVVRLLYHYLILAKKKA